MGTVNGQQKIHKNSFVENFKYTKYKFISLNLEVNKIMHFAIYLYIIPISHIAIYCCIMSRSQVHRILPWKSFDSMTYGWVQKCNFRCPGHIFTADRFGSAKVSFRHSSLFISSGQNLCLETVIIRSGPFISVAIFEIN